MRFPTSHLSFPVRTLAGKDQNLQTKPHGADSSNQSKLAIAAAVFTIVGVLVALGAWLFPRSSSSPGPAEGRAKTGATSTVGTPGADQTTGATGAPPSGTYLETLTPVAGAANLRQLPRALQGQPAYAHALTIPCASGQTSDKVHEVTYELRGPYVDPPGDIRVQVQAFRELDGDSAVVGDQTVGTGSTGVLDASVEGAAQLRLRVTCELPAAVAILTDALLTR